MFYVYIKFIIMDDIFMLGDGIYFIVGKVFVDILKNIFVFGVNYYYGLFWLGLNVKYCGEFWVDWVNIEKVLGYIMVNFNGGWNFGDVVIWVYKVKLKVNVNNLIDCKVVIFVSVMNFLFSNVGLLVDLIMGKVLYVSVLIYNLLFLCLVMFILSVLFN